MQRQNDNVFISSEPNRESLSPISVIKYKETPNPKPIRQSAELPKVHNNKKFSQLMTREITLTIETPLQTTLPPIQRSTEIVHASFELNKKAYFDKHYKENKSFKAEKHSNVMYGFAHKYKFNKKFIQPVLQQKKQEKTIRVIQNKRVDKRENGNVRKTDYESGKKRFSFCQEEFDESRIDGWESDPTM
ncbi:hypothetical protein SteCoe_11861 [Stentor coeruleus]|uniref:Uncharacterized protein n=1 Tax=Stentor coeruleus TaxID=5963 RepID=A0A1R2CC57_9CILI|nr:hypothetical protein SteCoe_11861 [Stentor coeruleus]